MPSSFITSAYSLHISHLISPHSHVHKILFLRRDAKLLYTISSHSFTLIICSLYNKMADMRSDSSPVMPSSAQAHISRQQRHPTTPPTTAEAAGAAHLQKQKPRLTGALRGLDPNSVLEFAPTQRTIESHDGSHNPQVVHDHGTRTRKHGRLENTYDMYNMK